MEIKAGDKVRIKSWEKLLEENAALWLEDSEEIGRGPAFVMEMSKFCGEELGVIKVRLKKEDDGETYTWFEVEGDLDGYYFSSWMVEEVIQSEI